VVWDIFCVIIHVVSVKTSFSLNRDVIGWRQSKTMGNTLCEKVDLRQFASANTAILADLDPELDYTNTENYFEMKKEAEEWTPHLMARVHGYLEMWQGGQNLCTTQKESRTQNNQISAVGYLHHTEEFVKASWSLFHYDGAAAFISAERSPMPPPSSAKDLPGGQTHISNIRRI
jgi:hypothetical protein